MSGKDLNNRFASHEPYGARNNFVAVVGKSGASNMSLPQTMRGVLVQEIVEKHSLRPGDCSMKVIVSFPWYLLETSDGSGKVTNP